MYRGSKIIFLLLLTGCSDLVPVAIEGQVIEITPKLIEKKIWVTVNPRLQREDVKKIYVTTYKIRTKDGEIEIEEKGTVVGLKLMDNVRLTKAFRRHL